MNKMRERSPMNIASIPIANSSIADGSSIGTAVLAKSLDTAETAGQDLIRMMEQSVNPDLGTNIDLTV